MCFISSGLRSQCSAFGEVCVGLCGMGWVLGMQVLPCMFIELEDGGVWG